MLLLYLTALFIVPETQKVTNCNIGTLVLPPYKRTYPLITTFATITGTSTNHSNKRTQQHLNQRRPPPKRKILKNGCVFPAALWWKVSFTVMRSTIKKRFCFHMRTRCGASWSRILQILNISSTRNRTRMQRDWTGQEVFIENSMRCARQDSRKPEHMRIRW